MQRIDLTDFAGGLSEQLAADNFSGRQWSKIKGFIFDTDQTVRSQWAAQSIGGSTAITSGAKAVSGFTGSSNSYLVAIANDGFVWWATAPSDTANYTTANAVTWTKLTAIAANTDYRFITEVLLPVTGVGEVNALLLHSVSGTTDAVAIYENDVTSSIATQTWNRFYPVDQPNLISPLLGDTDPNSTTAKIYTATTSFAAVPTFTGGVTSTVAGTPWTVANDGAFPVDVRIDSGSTITTIAPLDSYTHTVALALGEALQAKATGGNSSIRVGILLGSFPLARRNVMPRANVGCMWRQRLLLGDINTRINPNTPWDRSRSIAFVARSSGTAYVETTANHDYQLGESVTVTAVSNPSLNGTFTITAVGSNYVNYLNAGPDITTTADTGTTFISNIQRNPYSFFYSEVFPDSFHEQSILQAGSGESQILGMHVLDDYLITIASPATESDGLRLFKGTLDYLSLQQGTVTININVLRGGIGPTRDLTSSGNRFASCVWAEAGIVVFLDRLGGVWYTDGIEVDRLDRIGPIAPDLTTATDEVTALGKYLFVKRAGRYLVLNMMSGARGQSATAAWTELVLPTGLAANSLSAVAGSMYYVMNNRVYRFCIARNNAADTERASFDNVQVDCTIGTPTMADTNQHQKVNWFRFGMRSRGRSASSQVRTVRFNAGPTLDPSTFGYTKALNRTLADRDEFVLPAGIGTATEASAEVTYRGDVMIESATFWTSGGKFSRPSDGSDA